MNSVCFILCCFTSSLLTSAILSQKSVSLHPEMEYVNVCSNTSFEAICISQGGALLWGWSAVPGETITFIASNDNDRIIGDLLLKLVSINPYNSTATLSIVEPNHNGTTLSCVSTLSGSPSADQMATLTILVPGPPSAPLIPKFLLQSSTSVKLSWTSPNDHSHCITSYTITLTNISQGNESYIYRTVTNATSKIVSDLTRGLDYSFTVVGVDARGRMGEKSISSEVITLDIPEKVANLSCSFSSCDITITWMTPPPSIRPPVIGYKISHNATGSVLVNQTNDTKFAVEAVVPGIYLITVLAFNILGEGEEEKCSLTASAHSSQAITTSPQHNMTCSKNVAYDTVSNTLKIGTQVKLICSDNIAYATARESREDSTRNTTTSHTAMYEEVSLR